MPSHSGFRPRRTHWRGGLQRDERFAFGTWKIEILGGYTSAIFLVGVVAYMGYESVSRLMSPAPIAFNEAIGIACLGLLVNLASAWLLAGAGGAGHGHSHGHSHSHGHGPCARSWPLAATASGRTQQCEQPIMRIITI